MKFDDSFEFGISTTSYSVEGAYDADGKGASIWDEFCKIDNAIIDGNNGNVSSNHYELLDKDIALLKDLGISNYNFSISWARIFPEKDTYNEKGMEFYKNLCEKLIEQDITVTITLYHWDLPEWCQQLGGWTNRNITEWFLQYCQVCFKELDKYCSKWITIASPLEPAILGYYTGEHAPGHKDINEALTAIHHLLLAHGACYKLYVKMNYTKPMGISLNVSPVHPATDSIRDQLAAEFYDGFVNRMFLEPLFTGQYPTDILNTLSYQATSTFSFIERADLIMIYSSCDFVGLTYSNRTFVSYDENAPYHFAFADASNISTPKNPILDPNGLKDAIDIIREYSDLPIYITESGYSCKDVLLEDEVHDKERMDFIMDTLKIILKLNKDGEKIYGYSVKSLLDGFEWNKGFTSPYGLVYVDFDTMDRYPKDSYYIYKDIIKERGF